MAKLNKVREELSQRFVEALSMGELPWHSCWQQALPQNAVTGRKYHGLNALWLSYLAEKQTASRRSPRAVERTLEPSGGSGTRSSPTWASATGSRARVPIIALAATP